MSFQVSIVTTSNMKAQQISDSKVRPTATFHPNIWKDYNFLAPTSYTLKLENGMIEESKELKEEVRKMLTCDVENPINKLKLVDSIQRLGVIYHFEKEIHQVLEQLYVSFAGSSSNNHTNNEDLNTTALLFRLLRQQGYQISCDIFSKFMEENGKFKEILRSDAKGILSLYEATHMRIHGEDLLEDALHFTTKHLKQILQNSNSPFTNEISKALKLPIRKALPRLNAREYIAIYEEDPSHNDALLAFSKLDFNILQKLHQNELNEITRWWKELNVSANFPFARDRIVESYFWILGVYFEPHFNIGRKIITKIIAMTTIMDDIYDAYGTFEELQVFTLAIKRWDISMINLLPEYMKVYYTILLDLFEDINIEMAKDGTSYRAHFAKEAMKRQAEYYLKEAEWLNKKYKPTFEEYMEVASASSGYELLSTISFACMGDLATKEVFDWLSGCPKILEASTIICRLMDDIVSYKFEKEREHVVSAVECYMENYGGSEEETCAKFQKQVEDAWKNINECCLHPTNVPMPFLMCILNLTRVIALLYSNEDGYTNAKGKTKLLVQSLLVDPVRF